MSSISTKPTGATPTSCASPAACETSAGPDARPAPAPPASGATSSTSKFTLDDEQNTALDTFERWRRNPDAPQIFTVLGQAGTGKTTLAREFKNHAKIHYSAFTNKATFVLRSKGCNPANTLHSLLKIPEFEPTQGKGLGAGYTIVKRFGKLSRHTQAAAAELPFADKQDVDIERDAILVVDEASMIDKTLGPSITELPNRIVLVMDDFQLPPVKQTHGFFLDRTPDVTLTHVHRAKNPGTLDIATHIRRHQSYPRFGNYDGGSQILDFFDRSPAWRLDRLNPLITQADQIICGFNASRVTLNRRARALNHLDQADDEAMPVPGDKLVCYRNSAAPDAADPNHQLTVINGSLWQVVTAQKCLTDDDHKRPFMLLTLASLDNPDPDAPHIQVKVLEKFFWHPYPDKAAKTEGGWDVFTFGYAITCHKAQGSEWDNVLVLDHSWRDPFTPFRWKWLYTAVTRASRQITLVRGPVV